MTNTRNKCLSLSPHKWLDQMNEKISPTTDISSGDKIQGKVTGLAFGGQGILRHQGLVIFIPFTAVGDLITCQIIKKKKNYAYAQLVEVHELSPMRITPHCPYYERCGGCQLQHLNYQTQLESKRLWVEESLKRIGRLPIGIVPPVVPAIQWKYRRHITLQLKPNDGFFVAGYISNDNQSLIEISSCSIFAGKEDKIINDLQEFVRNLQSTPSSAGRVTIIKNGNEGRYLLSLHFNKIPSNCIESCKNALKKYPQWNGIVVNTPGKQHAFGNTQLTLSIDNLQFSFSAQSFVQNHPEQSINIYRAICNAAKHAHSILDLYCGIGISSILLAKQGARVLGVENNAEAVQLARSNAKSNGATDIEFLQADVEQVILKNLKERMPEIAIINPPRIGLSSVVSNALMEKGPAEIIYISCMPSTLARDLQILCHQHYHFSSCQAFDMFPQTSHVETVVHLKRNPNASYQTTL